MLPAAILVTSAADSGPGSLRQAILTANSQTGAQTIDFNIATGTQQITLLAALPQVRVPVTIDGTTQPGYAQAGYPLIVLTDGTATGTHGLPYGLSIAGGNSVVEGLVINGFSKGDAIDLVTGGGDVLEGNFIGTDLTGTVAVGNSTGILASGLGGNTIGGTTATARNLITGSSSGNTAAAVNVSSSHNLIEGNYVGTDITGTKGLGNELGIYILASNNTVGGTTSGARNLLSGNNDAISIASNSNLIEGNYIGTDHTGTQVIGNSAGVFIQGGSNTVGGPMTDAGKVFAGSVFNAIQIYSGKGNQVEGNYIGTDSTGTLTLSNHYAVYVEGSNNSVGGTMAGAGNTIAHNLEGVVVTGASDSIRGNSIFSTSQGIELRNGGNHNQAAPVITSANSDATSTTIAGTLTSAANSTFNLDFYATPVSGPNGQRYLGFKTFTTSANGQASFAATFPGVFGSQYITATATDPTGNTSAFSSPVKVTGTAAPAGSTGPDAGAGLEPALVPGGTESGGALTAASPVVAEAAASMPSGPTPDEENRALPDLGAAPVRVGPDTVALLTGTPDSSAESGLGGEGLSLADLLPAVS